METVEAFAHVARLHRHEHLQAAGKAQHGLASACSNSAAKTAWFALLISIRAPLSNSTTKPDLLWPSRFRACSTTASSRRTCRARPCGLLRRQRCNQPARVEYLRPV